MYGIRIVCVGRLKEGYWRQAADEYLKRLSRFGRCEVIEIDEYRLPENPSALQIEAALKDEAARIAPHIKGAAVALCIEGEKTSSEGFARLIDRLQTERGAMTFIIGGPWGLDERLKRGAAVRLSFSDMTFPHQMMRVILLEQIYRAAQISSGGRYHK